MLKTAATWTPPSTGWASLDLDDYVSGLLGFIAAHGLMTDGKCPTMPEMREMVQMLNAEGPMS